LIKAGPVQAIKYCHNGFILTGFIFRPAYFAKQEWSDNILNGYFPVINFGFLLSRYSILFVDRNWFHHTVLNLCHWESWGDDQLSQYKRLYTDYMYAISLIAHSFISRSSSFTTSLQVYYYELINYLNEIRSQSFPLSYRITKVTISTSKRISFKIAILVYPVYSLIYRILYFANRLVRTIRK